MWGRGARLAVVRLARTRGGNSVGRARHGLRRLFRTVGPGRARRRGLAGLPEESGPGLPPPHDPSLSLPDLHVWEWMGFARGLLS